MKKQRNIFICLLLVICISMSSLVACTNNEEGNAFIQYDVWTAPSTVKILQDDIDYIDKGEAKIQIKMAKNEYESTQLMITATKGKGKYSLEINDLINASGDKILKSAITVFNEKYVLTTTQSNKTFKPGLYPDALIPIDVATEYGENVVNEGYNQGLWIKVKTETDTKAGVYTGNFILNVNGNKTNIPVEVTVWDFAISSESHARSAFNIYYQDVGIGEGDNSNEMLEKYYEFFLDYRTNLMKLPCKHNDFDTYVELVKKYQDDVRVNTWCLPGFYHQESTKGEGQAMEPNDSPSFERVMELVSKIINESVKDNKNYLSKATFYDITTDEYSQKTQASKEAALKRYTLFRNYLKELVDKYDVAFGSNFIDGVDGLREDILYLPILSVSDYVSGVTEAANIWVPQLHSYSKAKEDYDRRIESLDTPNKEMWWYTCVGPTYPYPTYHIDDALYSSRIMSWMQYDYGITGNLFWAVATNTKVQHGVDLEVKNPYDNANRFGTNNGDGFLVYPGDYYGIDGPVATMRLESIRDGMEEYEYLYELDNAYKATGSYYNAENLSYKNICDEIFESLYAYGSVKRNLDVEVIETSREKIASSIEGLTQKDKFIIEKEEQIGNKKRISVLLDNSVIVDSNENFVSQEIAGQGIRYIYEYDISGTDEVKFNFSYTIDGVRKTFTKVLQQPKHILSNMNTNEALNTINVTEGSIKTLENGQVKVNLIPDTTLSDFKPYFGISMTNYKNLDIDLLGIIIYSNKDVDCELVYRTSTLQSAPLKIHLNEGVNHVSILLTEYPLNQLTRLVFRFPNEGDGYEIKIGELSYYE